MRGFLELSNRFIIEGKLKAGSALHIGSGRTSPEIDAPFASDGQGYFIPGSSLRGAMRSLIERIVQAVQPASGCILFEEGSHKSCLTAAPKKKQTSYEQERKKDEAQAAKRLDTELCDICKLFGSPFMASKLRVSDCRPSAKVEYQVRHGVGINRDTGTAEDGIKFDFEVVEPGQHFSFRLELENAQEYDFALVGILMGEITDRGIYLGGKKSGGLGLVTLEVPYTVFGFIDLAAYLRQADRVLPNMKAIFQKRADDAIRKFLEVRHAA